MNVIKKMFDIGFPPIEYFLGWWQNHQLASTLGRGTQFMFCRQIFTLFNNFIKPKCFERDETE
jgi:hypothetical protein